MTAPQATAHTTPARKHLAEPTSGTGRSTRRAQHHRLPNSRRLFALLITLALLVACQGEPPGESGPCAVLIVPASAIPVDQCPVTEVSTADLAAHLNPLTGEKSYRDKNTGKWVSPPSPTPAANQKLSLWPLWNGREPLTCRSCASVCDCKVVGAAAPRCGDVLGNRFMPDYIARDKRSGACGRQEGLPPGTVRCAQGLCVLMPTSATPTGK